MTTLVPLTIWLPLRNILWYTARSHNKPANSTVLYHGCMHSRNQYLALNTRGIILLQASKAENVSVTGSDFMNAPVANDPFGDSAFSAIPNQSSEQSTPPPGGQPAQPSYQPDSAPVQSAPTNSILDDFLDLSINPTPPQTGFQNGGMNFGSQAPSGMTPFDMHPNPGNTGFAPAPGFGGHNMGTANAFDQPAVADGGNPFGTASFGFQNPSNPATMNPPMNVGMGMAQPMGNPSMNPGMGMGTGTGVNYAMSGAARSSPVPANPVMVGDPFLTLSTEAGIRWVNYPII